MGCGPSCMKQVRPPLVGYPDQLCPTRQQRWLNLMGKKHYQNLQRQRVLPKTLSKLAMGTALLLMCLPVWGFCPIKLCTGVLPRLSFVVLGTGVPPLNSVLVRGVPPRVCVSGSIGLVWVSLLVLPASELVWVSPLVLPVSELLTLDYPCNQGLHN